MRELRDYQHDIIERLRDGIRHGHTRQVVGLATGGGKTAIAAALAANVAAKGRKLPDSLHNNVMKLWFLVERTPLIAQTVESFRAHGLRPGVLWADRSQRLPDEDCVVASTQTLASRYRRDKRWPLDMGLIVIDECHMFFELHRRLLTECSNVPAIGLSATPLREGLADYFTNLVRGPSVREMIEQGYLVPFRCFGPSTPDLERVTVRRGEFASGELSETMRTRALLGDVVSTWRRLGEDRQTICFAVDVAHSRLLAEEFQSEGVTAAHLDYRTSHDDRAELFDAFRARHIRVLISVGVLSLGFDVPDVGCVIQARPTMSESLHIQQCGRGARIADGKIDVIVLDHAGNCARHGLPQDFTLPEHLLDGDERKRAERRDRESLPSVCPRCTFLVPARSPVCPNCGASRLPTARVEVLDARLVSLAGERSPEQWTVAERRQFYAELITLGRIRGNDPDAAKYRYRDRFNEAPPSGVVPAESVSAETLRWVERNRKAFFALRDAQRRAIPIATRVQRALATRQAMHCNRCGHDGLPAIRPRNQHVGAFCAACDAWLGWIRVTA